MLWVIGGIAVLWFAVASAGFRRLLLILAGLAAVGLGLLFAWLQYESYARRKEDEAAKLRIPHSNIELVDLRMGTDSSFVKLTGRVRNNDPQFTLTSVELRIRVDECPGVPLMAGQQWNFSGIPKAGERPDPNAGQRDPLSALSKATGIGAAPEDPPDGLSEAAFRQLIAELEKAGARCETVGEATETLSVSVPPQQTREVDEYVSFADIGSPRMKRTWSYTVVSISGRNGDAQ